MRILTFSDYHLGVVSYGKLDPVTNLNSRVVNALKSLDKMIDYAVKENIKLIVFAGDAYHRSLPSPTLTSEFNTRINRAASYGIKVIILSGNHDVDKMGVKKSPLVVFNDLNVSNIVESRFHKEVEVTIDNETVKFVLLPTYHTQDSIEEIVNNTKYDGKPIVYVFHGTIKGAALNDWNIAEKEEYVDVSVFDKEGVAAVIMGHLHKHQVLCKKPLVFYVGSLQRVDFSEEKQKKGFVVMDINQDLSVSYEFIEIESQKFLTIDTNLIGENNETDLILRKLDLAGEKVKDAIVRIRVDVNKENTINERKIYEYAYELGAENILDIQKRFEKKLSTRVAGLTNQVSEFEALELYFKDKDNSEQIVLMGKEIIEKARKEGKI